jgi:hypothetical protein
LEKVKKYAQASGFTVAKTFTYNHDAKIAVKNNGISPVKQGRIYCSSLPGQRREKLCKFLVVFAFRADTLDYMRLHVSKLTELSQEDLLIIENIAEYCTNFSKALEHVQKKIPNKHIDRELFRRQYIIAKEKFYGPNTGRMPQLFETGNNIKQEGGIFEWTVDPTTQRLATLFLQTKRMQPYVEALCLTIRKTQPLQSMLQGNLDWTSVDQCSCLIRPQLLLLVLKFSGSFMFFAPGTISKMR